MEAKLTFGEYMRRLRRARKWNLNTLSESCNLSYPYLSRLENDSALPSAESVARLAQALEGDLKAMLEMANCLPRIILDRITSQEQPAGTSLLRTAGPARGDSEEAIPGLDHPLLAELKARYGLDDAEAGLLASAIDGIARLETSQRSSLFVFITSISAQGDSER